MKKLKKSLNQALGLAGYRLISCPDSDLPLIHDIVLGKMNFPFWITDIHTKSWWFKDSQEESAEIDFLFNFCDEDGVALDVGSHHGYQSIIMGLLTKNGQVHSFEANPVCALTLSANIGLDRLNNVYPNLTAIGANSRQIEIRGQSLAADSLDKWEVPMTSLDKYCGEKGINDIGLLKIDVEGYEGEVLKGAKKTLESRPHINLELHFDNIGRFGWNANEILSLLPADGDDYEISWINRKASWTDTNKIPTLDLNKRDGVINIFCVNKNRVQK